MSDELISPTKNALEEAFSLSEDILRQLELSEISLTNIALKSCRLARLLNDFDVLKIMEYEAGGYPIDPEGISQEVWRLLLLAGRVLKVMNKKTGQYQDLAYTESISKLEEIIRVSDSALRAAVDPSVSVSSANPNQYVISPRISNMVERSVRIATLSDASEKLASRKSYIYLYVQNKHYEMKYSGLSQDIFSRIRSRVDSMIGAVLPNSIKEFIAVYENLQSTNPVDWANAVHGCRRILQDFANVIYPPQSAPQIKSINGKQKEILLGQENYINRIIAYVEKNNNSERYEELIGSHLTYLGDRLDSVFKATQKGSHSRVEKEEADRYVVYTYLLIGDLLSLIPDN